MRQHLGNLGPLLGQVQSELARAIRRAIDAQGINLNYSQVQVLRRLYVLGPMSAGELSRSLCYDAGAMTRLLDQLEERNLLARHPHPEDRRALRILLSEEGKRLSAQLVELSEGVLDRALRDLEPGEREQLTDYMRRILQVLRAPDFT